MKKVILALLILILLPLSGCIDEKQVNCYTGYEAVDGNCVKLDNPICNEYEISENGVCIDDPNYYIYNQKRYQDFNLSIGDYKVYIETYTGVICDYFRPVEIHIDLYSTEDTRYMYEAIFAEHGCITELFILYNDTMVLIANAFEDGVITETDFQNTTFPFEIYSQDIPDGYEFDFSSNYTPLGALYIDTGITIKNTKVYKLEYTDRECLYPSNIQPLAEIAGDKKIYFIELEESATNCFGEYFFFNESENRFYRIHESYSEEITIDDILEFQEQLNIVPYYYEQVPTQNIDFVNISSFSNGVETLLHTEYKSSSDQHFFIIQDLSHYYKKSDSITLPEDLTDYYKVDIHYNDENVITLYYKDETYYYIKDDISFYLNIYNIEYLWFYNASTKPLIEDIINQE